MQQQQQQQHLHLSTTTTTTMIYVLLVLLLVVLSSSMVVAGNEQEQQQQEQKKQPQYSGHGRRLLHEIPNLFFSSSPPTLAPSISPTTTNNNNNNQPPFKYPFTSSSPPAPAADTSTQVPTNSFFPFVIYPSPPPPSPTTTTTNTLPANISSLLLPYSSNSHSSSHHDHFYYKSVLVKLIFLIVSVTLLISILALFLLFRRRRQRSHNNNHNVVKSVDMSLRLFPPNTTTSVVTTTTVSKKQMPPPTNLPPRLQYTPNSSREFLYLGTLVSSREYPPAADNNAPPPPTSTTTTTTTEYKYYYQQQEDGVGGVSSPELHPLPPLPRRHNNYNCNDNNSSSFAAAAAAPHLPTSPSDVKEQIVVVEDEELFSPSGIGGNMINNTTSTSSPSLSLSSSSSLADDPHDSHLPPPLNKPDGHGRRRRLIIHHKSKSLNSLSSLAPLPHDHHNIINNNNNNNLLISTTSFGTRAFPAPQFNINPAPAPPRIPFPPSTTTRECSPRAERIVLAPSPPLPQPMARLWEGGPPKLVAPSMSRKMVMSKSEEMMITTTTKKPKLNKEALHYHYNWPQPDHNKSTSSFHQLNEEMIKTPPPPLFMPRTSSSNINAKDGVGVKPRQSPDTNQENLVLLEMNNSQNISILFRALNVTVDEVCEALTQGNTDALSTELLESLLKMAPTKEEEVKLKEVKDDSAVKLGTAETFLKAVLDIPFAFKRVDAMLYIANFESEAKHLKRSFETLESACKELKSSRMFRKLLEAVLETGNRMKIGTNCGDARAFKLDTLLKLVDVKGKDEKKTLLHFVVQEITQAEGARLSGADPNSEPEKSLPSSLRDEVEFKKLGLQVVSRLSGELTNVKKSASMDLDVLSNDVAKLVSGIGKITEVTEMSDESGKFLEQMNKFLKRAKSEIVDVQVKEGIALSMVKGLTEYFHGDSGKEEAHPLRIFMVVKDFLGVLDQVCKDVGKINERKRVNSGQQIQVPTATNPCVFPGFGERSSSDGENHSIE